MKQKNSFSGQIGFVFAAAGSAVGVGNLWRFPYLAAKDGGGLFLIIYLALVLTVGFVLLTTDIAIGRKTGKSAIYAYESMRKKWKFLGVITFLVPVLIMTYYAVIGGWILRYIVIYLTSSGKQAVADDCFTAFISSPSSVWYGLIFMLLTALIVYNGVEEGIERVSKFIMPVLLIMVIGIAIFSLTLKTTLDDGTVRTGLQGLKVYMKPDLTGITVGRFLQITLDAMSQLFFSLSVSMGIMITYGSYVKNDIDLNKATNQIEIFDTGVAILAGMMIIPAVFVFLGNDGMASGPSLIFISLPKVFDAMGVFGRPAAIAFFLMMGFAALTSCVSVMETLVANGMELYHKPRKKMCGVVGIYSFITAVLICLGYNKLYFELKLPNGSVGQLLDVMDYISNSFTSDKYPDRLGNRTGLDHRRSRTQRREIQTCRYVPLYDPLCCSGRNACPVPCIHRIRRFNCINYWILNVCESRKKTLHFTFQHFRICSILQSCFRSDSVFLV